MRSFFFAIIYFQNKQRTKKEAVPFRELLLFKVLKIEIIAFFPAV